MIKIIIAGNRTFNDYKLLSTEVEKILVDNNLSYGQIEIVSGHARGADSLGERFALDHNIKLEIMPANWDDGKGAGYERNMKMLHYVLPDGILIAFWDGRRGGTKHMIGISNRYNLKSYIIRW